MGPEGWGPNPEKVRAPKGGGPEGWGAQNVARPSKTPPKFNEKTPQRVKKERNLRRESEKKAPSGGAGPSQGAQLGRAKRDQNEKKKGAQNLFDFGPFFFVVENRFFGTCKGVPRQGPNTQTKKKKKQSGQNPHTQHTHTHNTHTHTTHTTHTTHNTQHTQHTHTHTHNTQHTTHTTHTHTHTTQTQHTQTHNTNRPKTDWPKMDWPKMAKTLNTYFGQKWTLAKIGRQNTMAKNWIGQSRS